MTEFTEDDYIELAAALEMRRALHIVAEVAALPVGGKDAEAPTPFQAGYQLACEEIAERIRTQQVVIPGGAVLPQCGTLPSIKQPQAENRPTPQGKPLQGCIDDLIGKHGSLRAVARECALDVGYLSCLHRGEKDNPSDATLEALGLRRHGAIYSPVVTTTRAGKDCSGCRDSDSWGIPDRPSCAGCAATPGGKGSLYVPLNGPRA